MVRGKLERRAEAQERLRNGKFIRLSPRGPGHCVNTNLFPLEMSSSTTADGATASVPQNVDSHDQLQIPKAAIKRIMKLDPEVSQVANDAVVLVAKATEMFLEKFAGAARARATGRDRQTVTYEDLAVAARRESNYEFLTHVLPEPGGGAASSSSQGPVQ